jgi:hypothetical protein
MTEANETVKAQSSCCGGPAPKDTDACCVQDANAKASGGAGCGCDCACATDPMTASAHAASSCCG